MAAALLDHELVREFFDGFDRVLWQRWTELPEASVQERERIYYLMRGGRDFRDFFTAMMKQGEMAEKIASEEERVRSYREQLKRVVNG